jgi:chaperone modulatory protein CbpM
MTPLSEIHSPHFHLSFEELCLSADISKECLLELVENDIAVPVTGTHPQQWQFHVTCLIKVKKAARLYRDLDIDWADLGLVLNLLDEIEQLKNENSQLKQQLARFFQ